MDNPPDEDEKYKSLAFPVISDTDVANKIIENILSNECAVIGLDTEAAVEMSRFGILCLLQVINNFK
jgi:ribonuclease D